MLLIDLFSSHGNQIIKYKRAMSVSCTSTSSFRQLSLDLFFTITKHVEKNKTNVCFRVVGFNRNEKHDKGMPGIHQSYFLKFGW